jgi:hypothetical protein
MRCTIVVMHTANVYCNQQNNLITTCISVLARKYSVPPTFMVILQLLNLATSATHTSNAIATLGKFMRESIHV